jgi:hypothetical protein
MVTNASFDGGLTGYSTTSSWQFNQTLDQSVVGTVYNIRTAVQNPAAAPSGSDAAAYPVASLNAFVINENDAANDRLTAARPTGNFVTYFNGQIHVWFDMGWRQAGGTTNFAATLKLQLNNVTYLTITTVAGNSPGNAVATLANGASLGANTPSTYTNTGGGGSVSQWNTIHVIIPYSGTVPPDLSFVMSGGGGVSDDFAIDRLYLPLCQVSAISFSKTSQILSDPKNGSSNPKAIPGATVRYCFQLANPANNPSATTVTISDSISALPLTYVAGSLRINGTVSGGLCNADGVPGGSVTAGVVAAQLSTLAAGATRTIYFDVLVN